MRTATHWRHTATALKSSVIRCCVVLFWGIGDAVVGSAATCIIHVRPNMRQTEIVTYLVREAASAARKAAYARTAYPTVVNHDAINYVADKPWRRDIRVSDGSAKLIGAWNWQNINIEVTGYVPFLRGFDAGFSVVIIDRVGQISTSDARSSCACGVGLRQTKAYFYICGSRFEHVGCTRIEVAVEFANVAIEQRELRVDAR